MQTPHYIYTFLRKDLTQAQSIIQAAHACFEMGLKQTDKYEDTCHLVLLATESQDSLGKIEKYLATNGIEFTTFYEPDDDLGKTAIATIPIQSKEQRKLFKKFQLWKP